MTADISRAANDQNDHVLSLPRSVSQAATRNPGSTKFTPAAIQPKRRWMTSQRLQRLTDLHDPLDKVPAAEGEQSLIVHTRILFKFSGCAGNSSDSNC